MADLFIDALKQRLKEGLKNYYTDNFDSIRFGKKTWTKRYRETRAFIRYVFANMGITIVSIDKLIDKKLKPYLPQLEKFYQILADDYSKDLMVNLMAFKILGYSQIKHSVNNASYWQKLKKYEQQAEEIGFKGEKYMHSLLYQYDLRQLNYDFTLNFTPQAVLIYMDMEQYAHHKNGINISATKGETVIDAGGCLGDTALYFADKVGETGKVYSFEFIPYTINCFNKNLDLNKHLQDRIHLIKNPLWSEANKNVYFTDRGSGSRIEMEKYEGYEYETVTVSIDELVNNGTIEKVDFIKMDIEGAELPVLKGAIESIKKYKPKLAISIYHSMEDFVNIPAWIHDLGVGYKLYLGHYTIHDEETILFATTA